MHICQYVASSICFLGPYDQVMQCLPGTVVRLIGRFCLCLLGISKNDLYFPALFKWFMVRVECR